MGYPIVKLRGNRVYKTTAQYGNSENHLQRLTESAQQEKMESQEKPIFKDPEEEKSPMEAE